MADPKDKVRNVILCEDIRDEIGNKKSLMGVMGGDIIVATMPAAIQVAIYFEYHPDDDESEDFALKFRLWQDDTEIATGEMQAPIARGKDITLVVPRGMVLFEKEGAFRITASVRGGPEFQILSKKLMLAATS